MSVQLRMTLVETNTPLSRDDMGVWLLIIRPTARLNDPENSVKEQTGRQVLNAEHWTVEAHATQLVFTPQTFTLSFKSQLISYSFEQCLITT